MLGYVPVASLPQTAQLRCFLPEHSPCFYLHCSGPAGAAHALVLCCPVPSAFLTLAAYIAWTNLNQ